MDKRVRVQDIEYDAINHMQDDIVVLLKILGLPDCARDISPHEVMVNEIIPAVKDLSNTVFCRRKSKMKKKTPEIVAKHEIPLDVACGHPGCRAMSKRICDNYCYGHRKFIEMLEKARKEVEI